ncbi:MAG: metallophosphoesterase family protein [Candidatus Kuenenia sp.]|nr:metallophosphoesterase family protein [Candidatus Kuenenia hertensis]
MKILIISDIHGNEAALNAVLEQEVDEIFCLGDIVNYGPYPGECIERIRKLTDKIVRGNHDNAIGRNVECGCSEKYKALSDQMKNFTKSALNSSEKEFLANLPITLNIETGGTNFLLSHGSPGGDIYKYLRPDVTDKELEGELDDIQANIVFIGHTHLPMVRKIGDITIINPGSVGQPRDGIPEASYAIWEDGTFEIRRVSYDIDATARGLWHTGMPAQYISTLEEILRRGGM